MYDNFHIPDPVQGDWVEGQYPAVFQRRRVAHKLDLLNPEVIREVRRRYYGQISQIDYHLGRLFGALRTRGLDPDTAIVFTSDHGECLGDHGLFAKHCFLESAAHVPRIIRLPAARDVPSSAERHAPTQTADISPTLLDLVGLPQDDAAEGKSLLPRIRFRENTCRESACLQRPHAWRHGILNVQREFGQPSVAGDAWQRA